MKKAVWLIMVLGSILLWAPGTVGLTAKTPPAPDPAMASAPIPATEAYGRLPQYFVENQGQVDSRARFYTLGQGIQAGFSPREITLSFPSSRASAGRKEVLSPEHRALEPVAASPVPPQVVRWRPVNLSRTVKLTGADLLPGKFNHFKGSDPSQWRAGLPTYGSVVYRQAYPGVDLKFYGQGQQLEYDIIVRPGANPSQVRFRLDGIKSLEVTPDGDLAVNLPGGEQFLHKKPLVYQENAGRRVPRQGQFKVHRRGAAWEYGFEVAAYNRTLPLVIDPVIIYSTYFGGTLNDYGLAVAADDAGNAYITGRTYSPDFVTYPGSTHHGNFDVFVLKLSPKGNVLLFSTLLGGTGLDGGRGVAVSRDGSVWVTGDTSSDTFPTMSPLYSRGGAQDAFIAKLNGTTGALLFSTFMGGTGNDIGRGIAVDSNGNAWMVGESASNNFPLKNQLYGYQGGRDAILVKIKADASAVLFSTYLGGSNDDVGTSVAVGYFDDIFIAGYTSSSNFPMKNALQGYKGGWDAFISSFTYDGKYLIYSTYLGGTGNDYAYGIAMPNSFPFMRQVWVTGITNSLDFPVKKAFQGYNKGGYDAFVTYMGYNETTCFLNYSTYLGGAAYDTGNAIAMDLQGNAYVTGETDSEDFPRANPLYWYKNGAADAFVTKLNPKGGLAFSTYLGGNSYDSGYGIALDSADNVFVTGETDGTGFPTKNPMSGYSGAADLFIMKLGLQPRADFVRMLLLLDQ